MYVPGWMFGLGAMVVLLIALHTSDARERERQKLENRIRELEAALEEKERSVPIPIDPDSGLPDD